MPNTLKTSEVLLSNQNEYVTNMRSTTALLSTQSLTAVRHKSQVKEQEMFISPEMKPNAVFIDHPVDCGA
jgi:hypothetical protein